MHPTSSPQPFARLLVTLAVLNVTLALAQAAEIVETGLKISAANETTTLDRETQRLESRLVVTVANNGNFLVGSPLHLVMSFDALQGASLDELQVANALGGIGQPPYQTFYFECSAKSGGDGLAPGESFELDVRFSRPRTLVVRYNLQLAGTINRPPNVVDGGPYRGTVGEPISFDASESSDPENEALTFQWTLPDGSTLEGPTPQASFDAAGLQQVALAVSDERGATTTEDVEVVVLPPGEFALGRIRVLNGLGHPLAEVKVAEEGPQGSRQFELQAAGFGSLGSTPGDYLWRFSKAGHLSVCRRTTLAAGEVSVIPNPWMQELSTRRIRLSLLNDTTIANADGSLQVIFPGGAFTQASDAILTELHGQALPAALPSGWSPLRSFHLTLPQAPLQPGSLTASLPGEIPAGLQLVLASFDEANCEWIAKEILNTANGSLSAAIPSPGSFSILLADAAPTAPPAATVEAALPAFPTAPQLAGVSALGVLDRPEGVASRVSLEVTTRASVLFTGQSALPSGTWFQADVRENYELSGGQSLVIPEFDQTYYAYRSLGADPRVVTAGFPVRPTLLFGPEELNVARVEIDVLGRVNFAGGVVAPGGGGPVIGAGYHHSTCRSGVQPRGSGPAHSFAHRIRFLRSRLRDHLRLCPQSRGPRPGHRTGLRLHRPGPAGLQFCPHQARERRQPKRPAARHAAGQ